MGYSPQRELLEKGYTYGSYEKDKLYELCEAIKKNMREMKELADDFEESTKEQQRLTDLIHELHKEKTSTLDTLLLLKIIMAKDLADFDLVSDQVIAEAKEKYPPDTDEDTDKYFYEIWLEGAAWMYYAIMMKRPSTAYKTGNVTLDDAIQHCQDVLPICENDEVRKEHVQLGKWLKELKELRDWKNKISTMTKNIGIVKEQENDDDSDESDDEDYEDDIESDDTSEIEDEREELL